MKSLRIPEHIYRDAALQVGASEPFDKFEGVSMVPGFDNNRHYPIQFGMAIVFKYETNSEKGIIVYNPHTGEASDLRNTDSTARAVSFYNNNRMNRVAEEFEKLLRFTHRPISGDLVNKN